MKEIRRALSGVVCAVCLFLSFSAADSAEEDIPKKFFVPPPPFSEGIFPCSQCHAGMPANKTRRKLEMMHQDIELKHMPGGWCFDCHNPDNRDTLRLANGKTVKFEESYNLCGQCHGTILREWKAGLHGKRTGMGSKLQTCYGQNVRWFNLFGQGEHSWFSEAVRLSSHHG